MTHNPPNSPSRRLRCVLLGEQSLMIECGERLRARGHLIVAVVSDQPRLQAWAQSHAFRLHHHHDALLAQPPGEFDLLLNITWLRMLPTALIELPRLAAINFHDGPLPRYAGLNAPVWALLHGEHQHGVSWHRMAARADAGELLVQQHFEIAPDSTAFGLNTQCYEAGLASFDALLDALDADALQPLAQDFSQRSYFGANARPTAAGILDFSRPAAQLAQQVRALDFGSYANPVLLPRLRLAGRDLLVRSARAIDACAGAPGEVMSVQPDALSIRCGEGALRIDALTCLRGAPIDFAALASTDDDIRVGARLPLLDASDGSALTAAVKAAATHEAALKRALRQIEPAGLPFAEASSAVGLHQQALQVQGLRGVASLLLSLARCACLDSLPLALRPLAAEARAAAIERCVSGLLPRVLSPDFAQPLNSFEAQLQAALDISERAGGLLTDVYAREPSLRGALLPAELPLRLLRVSTLEALPAAAEAPLCLYWDTADNLLLRADAAHFSASGFARLIAAHSALLAHAEAQPDTAAGALDLLDAAERARLMQLAQGPAFSDAEHSPLRAASVHALIAAQAAATPEREALCFEDERLSYAELDARAEQLARRLAGAGVKPGDRVGLLLQRSTALVVGLLATLKAGAAYVPLDPLYPPERLAYMAEDAQLALLLCDAESAPLLSHANTLRIEAEAPEAALDTAPLPADALAYLIYTSGSTGRPKGVMVQHANVLRFFAGMDEVLGSQAGTWLAVTSISFDISVLELLWTLARGYRVVLYADARRQQSQTRRADAQATPIEFGLFFWNVAREEDLGSGDKYRLLLDSARYADANGFTAVWTPERHFAAFGGLYPNPAITSAALATITHKVALRAGSCVVPLHHPIRIAEEWAMVDNLSNGRVGLSIAAGWAAPDFALRPENHAEAKRVMFESAAQVQRLWRGETLMFPGPKGEVAVRTLPRPIQPELPIWVTTAGNPETFAEAGRMGANVLTHLLGQTVEEVSAKIQSYRRAYREAGHSGRGVVTLMLHTFVGDSLQQVEAAVRGPMKDYLRSAMALVKAAAWHFPTFKQQLSAEQGKSLDAFFAEANEADLDALLEFAFQRYFNESGLFGSPTDALAMVERAAAADVDEIACLIDFGIDTELVLAHLPRLNELRALSAERGISAFGRRTDYSLPALLEREGASHLQCTPSMAAMLAEDPACAAQLGRLDHLLLGGEALSPALAQRLRGLGVKRISNVYGPTETTVWSSAGDVDADTRASTTPIGRPLAGQRLHILDPRQQPLPAGLAGEIVIGGGGVTVGYWQRPELSAERFLPDGFVPLSANAHLYRTGDLGRLREDGRFECLGRVDQQIKIRGYRVELGEIEARLCELPGILEAAVLLREDSPGDQRLVGYVRAPGLSDADLTERSALLAQSLPEFMRPSLLMPLAELPRTPNGKLDRKALPAPGLRRLATRAPVAPASDIERRVAELWARALGLESVGTRDNFFDLGGHSLLVVQLLRELRERFDKPIQMTDLFRYTTVESLARFLGDEGPQETAADRGRARAQARQALQAKRRGGTEIA
ncbi:MupA/Atu3671 family FMN-dependent luciferase-like monooxygenase [Aquimonas sp.]|jgi:natural product biosynthesis luciferase-like monooxygenase protein|uniref:MupA/Atu3671 family FMN-dependent luciferase-like monooxygenase n=1 Tax=Aquimonas sp. TaxID=1872588 RepID=UPI0037BF0EF3